MAAQAEKKTGGSRSRKGGGAAQAAGGNTEDYLRMYRQMVKIRAFEDQANQLYLSAKMPGLTHMYSGQEAVAVGLCEALTDEDRITSTHRGHGHCVAKGAAFREMFCELLGREEGYCRGKGGSMHIADQAHGNLGANAIVGGSMGIATGAALTSKLQGRGFESQTRVAATKAALDAAEAAVAAAEQELERTIVRAPIAGVVHEPMAEPGSVLMIGGLCATIIQLDQIKVVGFVPEAEVGKVRLGAEAGARRHQRLPDPEKREASAAARRIAFDLCTVSWNSASGSLSKTTPPPAWM